MLSWWELPWVSTEFNRISLPSFFLNRYQRQDLVSRCSQAVPFWSLGEELLIPAVVAELILCARCLGGHKSQGKAKGTWGDIFRNTEQKASYLNVYKTMQRLNPEAQWVTLRAAGLVCFWSGWASLGLLFMERTKRINGMMDMSNNSFYLGGILDCFFSPPHSHPTYPL